MGDIFVLPGLLLKPFGLHQLLLFQRDQPLALATGVLTAVIPLLLALGGRRTRRGHMANLEERSAQIPQIVGQPVDQHGEGEVDAREDVHDREDEGHHLLHLVLRSLHGRPRHVPPNIMELRIEHGQAHKHDEDHNDYAACTLCGHEVVRNPQPEESGLFEFSRHLPIEGTQGCPLAPGNEGYG